MVKVNLNIFYRTYPFLGGQSLWVTDLDNSNCSPVGPVSSQDRISTKSRGFSGAGQATGIVNWYLYLLWPLPLFVPNKRTYLHNTQYRCSRSSNQCPHWPTYSNPNHDGNPDRAAHRRPLPLECHRMWRSSWPYWNCNRPPTGSTPGSLVWPVPLSSRRGCRWVASLPQSRRPRQCAAVADRPLRVFMVFLCFFFEWNLYKWAIRILAGNFKERGNKY